MQEDGDHLTTPLPESGASGAEPLQQEVTGTVAEPIHDPAAAPSEGPGRSQFRQRPQGWWIKALLGSAPPVSSPERSTPQGGTPTQLDPEAVTPRSEPRSGRNTSASARRRALVIIGVILVLLVILWALLSQARSTTTGSGTVTGPAAPTVAPFTSSTGAPIVARSVLAAGIGLSEPREAVPLLAGHIAIADTGHNRVIITDDKGHVTHVIAGGAVPLQHPFALAFHGGSLFVLDPQQSTINRYSATGQFQKQVVHNIPLLHDSRGMSVATDGTLYVANPRSNSINLFDQTGTVKKQVTSPQIGSDPAQWNQPADVFASANGMVYVVDNQNNRIKAIDPAGTFLEQWSAPTSDTFHAVHVLALPDDRVLATDPTGAIVIYNGRGTPVRHVLRVTGQIVGRTNPIGIALLSPKSLLVTDSINNRLLVLPIPT